MGNPLGSSSKGPQGTVDTLEKLLNCILRRQNFNMSLLQDTQYVKSI